MTAGCGRRRDSSASATLFRDTVASAQPCSPPRTVPLSLQPASCHSVAHRDRSGEIRAHILLHTRLNGTESWREVVKAAFSTWRGSIAPLFDESHEIRLVEARRGRVVQECAHLLAGVLPLRRALELEEVGVNLLVCGAISRPLLETLEANGIHVIPFVTGRTRDLVHAWLNGSLGSDMYSMPGCRRKGGYRWRAAPAQGRCGRRRAGRSSARSAGSSSTSEEVEDA